MKKIVYSIRKVKNSNEKLSGLGFIKGVLTLPFFMPNYTLILMVKNRQTEIYRMTFSNRNIPSGNCSSGPSAHISGSFGSG